MVRCSGLRLVRTKAAQWDGWVVNVSMSVVEEGADGGGVGLKGRYS